MKFLIQFLAIIVSAFMLELFLPWYSVAIAAFVFGYGLKSKANFLAGFLSISLLWFVKAWLIHTNDVNDLAGKVAKIFPLGETYLLFLTTILIGGLVGGFACLTGALAKPAKRKY
ncbi:MAG: hypothetical protein JNM57_12440 [Cyclobacteriaceae bacterium]|nr:hypothetical protein [Cyclobacteriaceae bacterium]